MFVTKAVFALSFLQTFSCQYPDAKSNVVYQDASLNDSNNSSIRGKGYRSFLVTLFNFQ
jgi:hypothetical protein